MSFEIKRRFRLWWDSHLYKVASINSSSHNARFILIVFRQNQLTCTITFIETQSDVHGLNALHGDGRATLHGILVFQLR